MLESTFYNLLNSILNLTEEQAVELLESYENFLGSLINNSELINEIRKQMRLEGLNAMDATSKKETLLADMKALAEQPPMELSDTKKQLYLKLITATGELYDKAAEDMARETVNISVELCHENARIPTYAHKDDAGFDIYLPEDFSIEPGETKIAKTGLKMAIPSGYELQIRPRSGNSLKTKLRVANAPGTIDCGYCDEIGIICDNIGTETINFKAGDRIAQAVLAIPPKGVFHQVDDILKVAGANRGGGYGSSGQ